MIRHKTKKINNQQKDVFSEISLQLKHIINKCEIPLRQY